MTGNLRVAETIRPDRTIMNFNDYQKYIREARAEVGQHIAECLTKETQHHLEKMNKTIAD